MHDPVMIQEQRRSRRIAMSPEERDGFLREQRTCRLATVNASGPHLSPVWFVWDGDALWVSSIVKSQRWVDIQRDPRVSVMVDAGHDFGELRGIEIIGRAEVVGEVPRTGWTTTRWSPPSAWPATSTPGVAMCTTVATRGCGSCPRNSSAGTSERWVRRDPSAPAAHSRERVLLDIRGRRQAPFPALCRLRILPAPARAGLSHVRVRPTAPEPVAGTGVVAGFTVNEHTWTPALPPPYIIAIVAIDEDPRVRLTTNLVDVPLSELAVGRRVDVRFEHVEDVWLPVFTLAPEGPVAGPLPVEEPTVPYVRPMARPDKFEDKVALTGIGMSRIGRRLGVDPLALTVEAARNAVEDAGLTMADIDGLSTYPGGPAAGGHAEGGVTALEDRYGSARPGSTVPRRLRAKAVGSRAAMLAVAAGLCRHVLCFRTVWESTWAERLRQRPPTLGGGRVEGDLMAWRMPYGALSPANWIAMNASNHFHRYGTTRAALGTIAVNARHNAGSTPMPSIRDPMTLDDYYGARIITSPFGLYDCDVPCDGSIAVMVSAADVAGDLRRPPVLVDAVGTQVIDRISWDQGRSTTSPRPRDRPPTCGRGLRYARVTSTSPSSMTDSPSTASAGSRRWASARPARRATSSPTRDASLSMASFPSTPSAASFRPGEPTGTASSTKRWCSSAATGVTDRWQGPRVAVVSTGGGTPGGCFLFTTAR